MTKSEMMDFIMKAGRERALYDLLLGISEFNDKGVTESPKVPRSIEVTKLVGVARAHLLFVSEFGHERGHVIVGEIHHFAYPEKFSDWIKMGAPGVSEVELVRLLDSIAAK